MVIILVDVNRLLFCFVLIKHARICSAEIQISPKKTPYDNHIKYCSINWLWIRFDFASYINRKRADL